MQSFDAYETSFTGGVRVATGDVNGDGLAEIVTGPGTGATPHVKVFSGQTGNELLGFDAYSSSFTGGVYVAASSPVPEPSGVTLLIAGMVLGRRLWMRLVGD